MVPDPEKSIGRLKKTCLIQVLCEKSEQLPAGLETIFNELIRRTPGYHFIIKYHVFEKDKLAGFI